MKYLFPVLVALILQATSCVQHKELVNFDSTQPLPASPASIANGLVLKVEPDDLLRISIHSINQEAAAPFTVDPLQGNMQQMMMQQGVAASSNYPIELFNGYLVDRSGGINLPVVGNVPVAGKTIEQIEDTITTLVKPYLKDAVVNVRFLNLRVNVLGEVNHPGIVRMSNQRLTILEALGNAGDFSPYANRTNVLLVREENGQRIYHRYNFQSNELFASPYFYLKQNDLVYVEPIKARVATVADPFQRGISYGTAFLSVITLFVALFR